MNKRKPMDSLLRDLQERSKELNCLYLIEEILHKEELPLSAMFKEIVNTLPSGFQFPEIAQSKIKYRNVEYKSRDYTDTDCELIAVISYQDKIAGDIIVSYKQESLQTACIPFLKEESKLIKTIADRIGYVILYKDLKDVFSEWQNMKKDITKKISSEWSIILDMLKRADRNLYVYISQKMLHYLCWNGIEDANNLLVEYNNQSKIYKSIQTAYTNSPSTKTNLETIIQISSEIFKIASIYFTDQHILNRIQDWIEEDKSRFLVKALDNPNSSLDSIINAITRYRHITAEGTILSTSAEKGLRVSLIRYFFSDQLDFIKIAKNHIKIEHYYNLIEKIIYPSDSHGRLGGKSSGLFLAKQILEEAKDNTLLKVIKTPNTWYLTSDVMVSFVHYNNLEGVMEQKYKDLDEINAEYQNIIQIFKNSFFPPEIERGLAMIIDNIGEIPIIVRSSSLLEDSIEATFSGKYKSLFLGNTGTKELRLSNLKDAISEVYASVFSQDPIEYRSEKGLLDFNEEMGILIQEVVGNKLGKYFFPSFAGVAFSENNFMWSSRIEREDGFIRMVPGLGTRAVDRLSDDYPIMMSPGKPDLRVNISPDEIIKYSPKYFDVINLDTNNFESVESSKILNTLGPDIPLIKQVIAINSEGFIQTPLSLIDVDFNSDRIIINFEGIFLNTDFIKQVKETLDLLKLKIGRPVDIEFAHDGKDLYLLQCRPQSYNSENSPSPIPQDIKPEKIIFTADNYITNGHIPEITHLVYVDPENYNSINRISDLKDIGKAIGKLNKMLPKKQFILMGPGRWGSRGDIKLGVNVSYADIKNTSVLIEIAREKGNYTPDLSFGTHFFQDLIEASIKYIPLYPDKKEIEFNNIFFNHSTNLLSNLLPEYSHLESTIKVIDIPKSWDGQILKILMNSDLNKAIGYLCESGNIHINNSPGSRPKSIETIDSTSMQDEFWRWRYHMAETIASKLSGTRFGVKAIYLFGSTKNASAGPSSDIDILIHFIGTAKQKIDLENWMEGWSLTLSENNFLKTGYKTEGILDLHFITDVDIEKKTSFALKINAVTDAAHRMKMKSE
jgi:pyruvate, water dikinase